MELNQFIPQGESFSVDLKKTATISTPSPEASWVSGITPERNFIEKNLLPMLEVLQERTDKIIIEMTNSGTSKTLKAELRGIRFGSQGSHTLTVLPRRDDLLQGEDYRRGVSAEEELQHVVIRC